MRTAAFIQRKFQAWAERKNIRRQGSEAERGELNYTFCPEDNVFGRELLSETRSAFEAGAGGELRGSVPSMCALHSSAAMAVNLFQHWVANRQFRILAELLRIPSIGIESVSFERKYPVCADWKAHGFNEPPHLDLGIDYVGSGRVGIECKLFEPYGRLDHAPLKPPYLALTDSWHDIPAWRVLAEELADGEERSTIDDARTTFRRLAPAQLVRHVLGLKFGQPADKVRLVYLYFDAIGDEAEQHRTEIRQFQQLVAPDPIRFVPMAVQEFILRAVSRCRDEHQEYVDYLADRYL